MMEFAQKMVRHIQGLKNFAVPSPIFRFFDTESVIISVVFSHNILAETGCSSALIVAANLLCVSTTKRMIWARSSCAKKFT